MSDNDKNKFRNQQKKILFPPTGFFSCFANFSRAGSLPHIRLYREGEEKAGNFTFVEYNRETFGL